MAIAIATLGLLGLVIYTVESQTKEISIRKIIGAETSQLVRQLSKGFIKLIIISGFVAVPLGYTLSFYLCSILQTGQVLPFGIPCFVLGSCWFWDLLPFSPKLTRRRMKTRYPAFAQSEDLKL
jgi:putative ABC transport system permease protein